MPVVPEPRFLPSTDRATTRAVTFSAHRWGGFALPLARTTHLELLDRLGDLTPGQVLSGNLRDIRRANRWFGGTRAIRDEIAPLARRNTAEPLSILDVATGSADIPVALVNWAEREGNGLRIVATDLQPAVLAVARAAVRPERITVEQADALSLPYPDDTFDVVTLSLALHHFEPEDAQRVLREMGRVARQALIVNDLERSRSGYLGAWLFAHLLTTNPMTRNDAPLSVRRAYTRPEALALAHAAGWHRARVRAVVPCRYMLTGRPA
ncbi:MAG: methyltransferase domain-containing protein [Chloroflexota bacterium]|nr:methyltransferase domain-containing protein [Chloroflexota bacterium]